MSDSLPSAVLVGALLRRVNDAGGIATVLARGDSQGGAILVVACERSRDYNILERSIGASGGTELIATPIDSASVGDYWRRRRSRDPDLWVIELDIAQAERFAAETIAMG